MGGACVYETHIKNYFIESPKDNQHSGNGQIIIHNNTNNKNTNKTSYILYNILENNKDTKALNKRYSDFLNYEKRQIEKNKTKIITNDVTDGECPTTSINEASFLNKKSNMNDELNANKKIPSVNNSSNFNGSNIFPITSKPKGNEINKEENNINNKTNFDSNKIKHKTVMNKIKEKENGNRKSVANINCNLCENNSIFINTSRRSTFMNNDIERFESPTPKMMIEKDHFEELAKGKKNLFCHFCKNRMADKSGKNINNQIITSVFRSCYDMNKYSEEMLNAINSIRTNPELFLKNIDYLINNNIIKNEEGIFLQSNEIDEKIKLMDNYMEMFNKAKENLRKKINIIEDLPELHKLEYNDDLEIILDESYNNDIDYNDIEYNEMESEIKEEKDEDNENDIRNIPSKLNLIYNYDDICDIDDDFDDEDYNKDKINEKENVIDFDNDDIKSEENVSSKNTFNHSINNNNDNNVNNKSENNYKICINNDNKKFLKKYKLKKKKNINNYLDLNDDKIANLILQKRKEIKRQYPKNIFKMSIIKDIKISIFIQIMMEEYYKENNKDNLKEIIFSPNFKHFALSWTNEINRNFISISCFA